jgi:hypothetical protein
LAEKIGRKKHKKEMEVKKLIQKILRWADIKPARTVIAAAKFELMDEQLARKVLAGRNERDPLVCALLTLLHEAKADAAEESNRASNPEWLAQRCAGGLHWLLQFEAELKEALSASAVAEENTTEL